MNRIEKATENTFNIGERIASVRASDALLQRLKDIPQTLREGYDTVPKKLVWAVAASIALLIAINILSASNYSKTSSAQTSTISNAYFDHLKTL